MHKFDFKKIKLDLLALNNVNLKLCFKISKQSPIRNEKIIDNNLNKKNVYHILPWCSPFNKIDFVMIIKLQHVLFRFDDI